MSSSYVGALEAAGAKVHAYQEFGDYQGNWFAKVTYRGKTAWVNGSFGSCSGCDALQAEFDYASDEPESTYDAWVKANNYKSPNVLTRSKYNALKKDFKRKYAEFGKRYLDKDLLLNQKEAEKKASRNIEWDSDAKEMLEFIIKNKITKR